MTLNIYSDLELDLKSDTVAVSVTITYSDLCDIVVVGDPLLTCRLTL